MYNKNSDKYNNSRRLSPEDRLKMVKEFLADKTTVADLCRKYGTTPRTLYKWKDRYLGGIGLRQEERVRDTKLLPKLSKSVAAGFLYLALKHPKFGSKRIAQIYNHFVIEKDTNQYSTSALDCHKEGGQVQTESFSPTTVYNVLKAHNLNTYRLRLKASHKWSNLSSLSQAQAIEEMIGQRPNFYARSIGMTFDFEKLEKIRLKLIRGIETQKVSFVQNTDIFL